MKKIVLKQFCKEENDTYSVRLGNGTAHSFRSTRQANQFLKDTSKFLTVHYFAVHATYMDVWQEYQRVWFYHGFGDRYSWSTHSQIQRKIEDALKSCEDLLDRGINTSDHPERGCHEVFRCISVASTQLKEAVKLLFPLFKSLSQTADVYRLESCITRLVDIETKIHAYGQLQATHHIHSPIKLKKRA